MNKNPGYITSHCVADHIFFRCERLIFLIESTSFLWFPAATTVGCTKGPRLTSRWSFTPAEEATEVIFIVMMGEGQERRKCAEPSQLPGH